MRNLNPESLTPCRPCVSAHEQAAGRTLWPTAWLELCPTGFYSRPLTYGQSRKSSWQFSSYLHSSQKDQARFSARTATQTQRPWGQETTRNCTCWCANSISEHGREDTAAWMCRHHRSISNPTALESLTPAAKAWLADYSRVHTSKRFSSNVYSFGKQPRIFAVC